LNIFRLGQFGAIAIATLLVAACGGPLDRGTVGNCPPTAILEGPGELTRYKPGSAKAPTDVLFRTKITTFSGICDFDATSIDVELSILIEAVRGPANTTSKAEFVYFVAILKKDKTVLTRTKFPIVAEFIRQDARFNFAENVTVTIPRRKNDSTSDYIVYLGFEMTPEELAHNRRRQRRR
jgi:hypothetical protein